MKTTLRRWEERVHYNSLEALNGTLINAVHGWAGVEGTWGTRRRGRGTPLEKNKKYSLGDSTEENERRR